MLTLSPSRIREIEDTLSGLKETNTHFVANNGAELFLSGKDTLDFGLFWIVPEIALFMNCSVEGALDYLSFALIAMTVFLSALGSLFFLKGRVHKLILWLVSSAFLFLFLFQNIVLEQVSLFWIFSFFPLFLWILRSRKKILPSLFLVPLSLLSCICFLISWKWGISFYILSVCLIFLAEQHFLKKGIFVLIIFFPLIGSLYWTHGEVKKAIVKVDQIEGKSLSSLNELPLWHDLMKGLGHYENNRGLPDTDRGLYDYVSNQGGSFGFMSDEYLSFLKTRYLFLLENESAFVMGTYFKKIIKIANFLLYGKLGQWLIAKVILFLFFLWGMIGLMKYLIVHRDFRITISFISVFLILSLWPILTAINVATCTPMFAFMYAYFTTLGIWDWERVAGDHFPFF